MPKIRMKTLYSGPTRSIQPDEVADVDAAEAKALVGGGYATYEEAPKGGSSTKKPPIKPQRGSQGVSAGQSAKEKDKTPAGAEGNPDTTPDEPPSGGDEDSSED